MFQVPSQMSWPITLYSLAISTTITTKNSKGSQKLLFAANSCRKLFVLLKIPKSNSRCK